MTGSALPTPEQIAAWTVEVGKWWDYYNRMYVGSVLRRPVLRIADMAANLGTWVRRERLLSIASSHLAASPWLVVMETLRHEMAHQYADEVLDAAGEPPHGPAFVYACDKLRVDRRATAAVGCGLREPGAPVPALPPGTAPNSRIVDVITKLLSLSTSPNANEAAAAMRKARALLVKYNIDLVELHPERRFESCCLGPIKQRHQPWEFTLSAILSEFFFVEAVWVHSFDPNRGRGRSGTCLQLFGTPENLELASWVWSYLTGVLDQLWRDYKRDRGLGGDRERQRYRVGLLRGFYQKLQEQRQELAERHDLVYQGDPALTAHFRWYYPQVRSRGSSRVVASQAYQDGKSDGRCIDIKRPLQSQDSGQGGLLPGPG